VEALRIKIGTFRSPGPGFFLFWSGVALGLLALALVVKKSLSEKRGENITKLWKGVRWSKVIFVLTSLFIYAILLPRLGYVITTFGLMVCLFGIIGRSRLWILGMSAFITVLITYVIFCVLLEVQMPKGIFGF